MRPLPSRRLSSRTSPTRCKHSLLCQSLHLLLKHRLWGHSLPFLLDIEEIQCKYEQIWVLFEEGKDHPGPLGELVVNVVALLQFIVHDLVYFISGLWTVVLEFVLEVFLELHGHIDVEVVPLVVVGISEHLLELSGSVVAGVSSVH